MEQNSLPRVRVVNPNESWLGTEYYINGKKIEYVKSVDFRVAVDEVPTFTFETIGLPDIDMYGDIRFSFTPETVEEAKKVLENENRKHHVELKYEKPGISAYVDGERVPCCKKIDDYNETEKDSMKFIPNENSLFSDYIQTNLSEYTKFAVIVLRDELLKHGDLYDGFLASIKSALDDCGYETACLLDGNMEVALEVIRRITGEE